MGNGSIPDFALYGAAHGAALFLILLLGLMVTRVPPSAHRSRLAWLIAVLLLGVAIVKPILYVGIYGQPWEAWLPLDLCRLSEYLCVVMLLRQSFRIFEIAYFLAMAGSISALLMPDLLYGFPDPRFLVFFISHGLSLLAVLYAVFGYGYRPTLHSVGLTLIFLGIYTPIIAGVNILLEANYLFLCEKPAGASVLDLFGPWPYYVIGLIALALVACLICYAPFALMRRMRAEPS